MKWRQLNLFIKIETRKSTLAPKITKRVTLKRDESSTNKIRIYVPMKTIAHLVKVVMRIIPLYRLKITRQ